MNLEEILTDSLKGTLKSLKDGPQKTTVQFLMAALESGGVDGISKIKNALLRPNQDLSWLPPRVASDLVAYLQNAEADHKEEMTKTIEKIEEVAIQVGMAIIKGLIAAL